MRSVWVVMDKTAGWDNIVGIFNQSDVNEGQLFELFDQVDYEIRSVVCYNDLEMFQ